MQKEHILILIEKIFARQVNESCHGFAGINGI